jgi:hypothetical protein
MPGYAVTLSNAVRTAGQLQFTIIGESNASYIIETSTNLEQWRGVASNRELGVTRTVTINGAEPQSYYRARVARAFYGALAARGFIELKGSHIEVDSFDSANPVYSTSGRYDPVKRRDGGDVASSFGLTNVLGVGNAKIYGKLSVAPGGGAVLGPSGCVGSLEYISDSNNLGTIQPGWLREEAPAFFPDTVLSPLGPFLVPTPGNVGGTNYVYVLGNQNYKLAVLSMSSGAMMVTNRATLWVEGNLSISGTAKIVVAPAASLILYVGAETGSGAIASIGGVGVVNQTYRAAGFQYYGLRSNSTVGISGNGEVIGTVYAPNADLTFNAGGAVVYDFSGAAVARSVAVNGAYHIHYDEDLARTGPLF